MADDLYNIVFKGELVRSFELDVVKNNMGKLFKISGPKLEALFSGKTIILKRNLSFEAANKYRVAIKKVGARIDLLPVKTDQEDKENERTPAKTQGKAVFNVGGKSDTNQPHVPSQEFPSPKTLDEKPLHSQPPHESDSVEDDSAFSLAPVGAEVLTESEKEVVVPVVVDVSAISLKDTGGDLLNSEEKRQYETLDLDLSDVSLAEAGEDLLKDSEKKEVLEKEVDISNLSIAEPGAQLGVPSSEPIPPAPDVSNITLKE